MVFFQISSGGFLLGNPSTGTPLIVAGTLLIVPLRKVALVSDASVASQAWLKSAVEPLNRTTFPKGVRSTVEPGPVKIRCARAVSPSDSLRGASIEALIRLRGRLPARYLMSSNRRPARRAGPRRRCLL